jgi:hypothetical protein
LALVHRKTIRQKLVLSLPLTRRFHLKEGWQAVAILKKRKRKRRRETACLLSAIPALVPSGRKKWQVVEGEKGAGVRMTSRKVRKVLQM